MTTRILHTGLVAIIAALCLGASPASATRDLTGPADTIAWAREINPHGQGTRYQWFVRPNGEGGLIDQPRGSQQAQSIRFRLDPQELAQVRQLLTQYRNVRLASASSIACRTDQTIVVVNQRGSPLLSTDYGCQDRNIATRHRIMEHILTVMRANRV